MSELLASLKDTGLLPWAASLVIVVIASMFLAARSRRASSATGRLRELEALREGRQTSGRYRAANMSRVAEDEEAEGRIPFVSDLLVAISGLIGGLPLLGGKDRENLRQELLRAGIRRNDALGLFIAAKISSSVLFVLVVFGLLSWLHLFSGKALFQVAACLAGMILGSLWPDLVLKRMISHRQMEIIRNLPDALDLMVICTEAGLSLDPTIERVAREIRLSSPELARELAIMSHEMRILPKRDMALINFAERNNYREVKSLMSTLIQTLRYGTSLAHSLRVLAVESRNARMLAVEEKAARLPAMMTIPLICCMLPAVFLVIGGPAISQVMKILHH
jgi:tight adherence protein C